MTRSPDELYGTSLTSPEVHSSVAESSVDGTHRQSLAGPTAFSGVPEPQPLPRVQTYPIRFTGTTGEYFRIWLVNAALTVVTLGIYAPWARIRNRQYFYGHTWLDGHNFEYTANPLALLRSYLIVAAFFLAYSLLPQLGFDGAELISVGILLLFALLYPWLVRQSMRFQARSTVHRGLNFQFVGTLGNAYVSYGLTNLIAGVTGALALPWAWFMQRRYQADGLAYGTARGHFRGNLGDMYRIGLITLGLSLLGGLFVALLVGGGMAVLSDSGLLEVWGDALDEDAGFGFVVIGAFVLFGLLYNGAWQYARAATMAYVLSHFELGGVVRVRATFNPWRLVWLSVGNTLARLISLGLLMPWAAIRTNRYILEHIEVRAIASLDDFTAGQQREESALGEAATELLDINLGF